MKNKIQLSEAEIHKQICEYIKIQYPKVLFNTDLAGLNMTMGQAKKAKNLRSQNGFPDIQILETRHNGTTQIQWYGENKVFDTYLFCGLFLEVKKETPYKKDGDLKKNPHLELQNELHIKLRLQGYMVEFVWTFEQGKKIIDNYLRK